MSARVEGFQAAGSGLGDKTLEKRRGHGHRLDHFGSCGRVFEKSLVWELFVKRWRDVEETHFD